MLHVACHNAGERAELYLTGLLENRRVSIHRFDTLDELLVLSQRFTLELIFLGSGSDDASRVTRHLDMISRIKNHIFLSIIPTVLYMPEPDNRTRLAAFENGAEEVFSENDLLHIARAKTRMMIARSGRDQAVNPSSLLPGPSSIELEIQRQIDLDQRFAVCYADLDNFKAYNDFYGYFYGDRVIRLTARIIKDVVFDICREGFVGHIGGDDYIFIIPANQVDLICSNIIRTFDTLIPYRYQESERISGQIVTLNRSGEEQTYPIMSISIAVVINRKGEFSHVGELSHMLADLKRHTKSLPGSNFIIERRRKY